MGFSPYQFPHYSYFGVAGSVLLQTRDQGAVAISTLFGQTAIIWNGTNWEEAEVGSAGQNEPLYLVTLSNGKSLTCSAGYNWYQKVTDHLTFAGIKSQLIAATSEVWRTETETDPYGAAGFPTIASVTATGTSGDLYYVASSSGLTLYNGVLASCGYPPEDGSGAAPPTPPPPTTVGEPVAPDRSFLGAQGDNQSGSGPVVTPV